jgi:outer membrane protein OmpA-like peptidoglycan-associated protein
MDGSKNKITALWFWRLASATVLSTSRRRDIRYASNRNRHLGEKTMRIAIVVSLLTIAFASASLAADLPGSKDPSGFKRYEGSEIIHTAQRPYSEYKLNRDGGWGKAESVEGEITRVIYLVPGGPTSLEVLRNYQKMLSSAGFQQTFELKSDDVSVIKSYFFTHFFFGPEQYDASRPNSLYKYSQSAESPNYATFKATKDGQELTVAVLAGQSGALDWAEPNVKSPFPVKNGQVVVAVDLVTAKAAEDKMVFVKASDMADALSSKGSIDLYGIYFDIDKTDIKPESGKTLDEVASLLKIDRSLRLEISGHTDNTGNTQHNMTLSKGRAEAVVDALVKKYSVDAARLEAKGYGDTKPVAGNDTDENRAKNRRVELRKL